MSNSECTGRAGTSLNAPSPVAHGEAPFPVQSLLLFPPCLPSLRVLPPSFLPFLPFSSLNSPPLSRSGPPEIRIVGLRELCKFPQRVRGALAPDLGP